jgi:hypothetical protein
LVAAFDWKKASAGRVGAIGRPEPRPATET